MWVTASQSAVHRGDAQLAPGMVKLLLDGQQRMTTLYGVMRGNPPSFFDGDSKIFSDLMFHVENERFAFHQPLNMRGDPLWINVTDLMRKGLIPFVPALNPSSPKFGEYVTRLTKLHEIGDVDLHVDEVTGEDKSVDVVVEIFNRVNSGGTKLSNGDLALAKVCAEWPDARDHMKGHLEKWRRRGYRFTLDWLLRSVNTVLTGEANFRFLHQKDAPEIQDGLRRASQAIDKLLNLVDGRLGLDHDRVLFGRFAFPVMVRYLDQLSGALSARERDKLLFWYVQAGMWGRFSGSTESLIDQDIAALERSDNPLDELLEQLRLSQGGLRVEPGHFTGWSLGARFYPLLYMLSRMGSARDWGTGIPLKSGMLGKMNRLEVHHIFPKSRLYQRGLNKTEVNALANFCFLTKETNLSIGNRFPEEYFPEIESEHPGALASQWIPDDPELWRIENYHDFLAARRELLAEETNFRMTELLHGDNLWLQGRQMSPALIVAVEPNNAELDEDAILNELNEWIVKQGLQPGHMHFDHTDPDTGAQLAVFDLAWPDGLQAEFSQPVAVLLGETDDVLALANTAGYRCFTKEQEFRNYVNTEISPMAEIAA